MTSSKQIHSVFVLAAGRGERLRPYTDKTPKPLMPIAGRPILDHVLDHLHALVKDFELKRVVINAWHLKDQIKDFVHSRQSQKIHPFEVKCSEEAELLGTGGGLRQARGLLDTSGPVLMINGDALFKGDLVGFCRRALEDQRADGAWWLAPEQSGQTAVHLEGRRIRRIGKLWRADVTASGLETERVGCFSGIQLFGSVDFEALPSQGCIVRDYWIPRLEGGKLLGGDFEGLESWVDIGTPERYQSVVNGF